LITNNPNVPSIKCKMTPTMEALIEYGQGNRAKIDSIRRFLDKKL
jgi:hypothetical protein